MLLTKENIIYMIIYIPSHNKSCLYDLLQGCVLYDITNDKLIQEHNIASKSYKKTDEFINIYTQIKYLKSAIKNSDNIYCLLKANLFLSQLFCKLSYYMMVNKYAYIIQKTWKNSITNPEYNICKKRLLNEFNKIISE